MLPEGAGAGIANLPSWLMRLGPEGVVEGGIADPNSPDGVDGVTGAEVFPAPKKPEDEEEGNPGVAGGFIAPKGVDGVDGEAEPDAGDDGSPGLGVLRKAPNTLLVVGAIGVETIGASGVEAIGAVVAGTAGLTERLALGGTFVGDGVADCLDLPPKPKLESKGGVPVRDGGASGGGVASLPCAVATGFFSVLSSDSLSDAL